MANELENPVPDPKDPRGVEYRAWLATPWTKKDQIRMLRAMIAGYQVTRVQGMLDAALLSARTRVRTPKLPKPHKRLAEGSTKTLGQIWSGLPRYVRAFGKKGRWVVVCRDGPCAKLMRPNDQTEAGAWNLAVHHWQQVHRRFNHYSVGQGGSATWKGPKNAVPFASILPDGGKGWA